MLPKTAKLLNEKQPLRLVMYGDSISEVGRTPSWHGGATAPERNWGAVLARRIGATYPAAAVTVQHFAIGGQNSYEGLGRLDGLRPMAPNLVLVAFGANDCGYHFLLPEETKLALVSLVRGIQQRYGADVVLCGTGGENPRQPRFRHLAETLAAQCEAANEAGVPFVAVRDAVLNATQGGERWADYHLGVDNCHPNDAGHEVWADGAWQVIRQHLPPVTP
jgi:lysophospholipase L1-like esterase